MRITATDAPVVNMLQGFVRNQPLTNIAEVEEEGSEMESTDVDGGNHE
jgi:hypothetical protein